MNSKSRYLALFAYVFISVFVLNLFITIPVQAINPPWFGQGCNTSYTGPNGLRAGGYDPTKLSQDQRQWLFEVFGNAGIAPVGYGGQTCPWQVTQAPTRPPWFGQGCNTSYTGPNGLRAGGYNPSSLSQDQRQWLFEVFGNAGIAPVGYGGQNCPWQVTQQPTARPAWFGQGCNTSYTGPGGIRAGGYNPSSLSQDQRQWLFEVFGNAGIAPVGYGGQNCPWQATQQPTNRPAWFGQGCNTSYTGPNGLRAGGYDPTKLSQDQRQWLFEVFGNAGIAPVGYGGQTCPWQVTQQPTRPPWFGQGCNTLYSGPGNIRAGGYDPTKLTQDQRQWLFEVFGNIGIAPVGYGGQICSGQNNTLVPSATPTMMPCPSGVGPDGITAGSYDPTKLTQAQRQWLFEVFGNNGIAPVGYGGQSCAGSTLGGNILPTVKFTPSKNSTENLPRTATSIKITDQKNTPPSIKNNNNNSSYKPPTTYPEVLLEALTLSIGGSEVIYDYGDAISGVKGLKYMDFPVVGLVGAYGESAVDVTKYILTQDNRYAYKASATLAIAALAGIASIYLVGWPAVIVGAGLFTAGLAIEPLLFR